MKRILFLCSGNYYRSRFAELLFNSVAAERGLPWRADSRGLACEDPDRNAGPISSHALRGLESLGILCNGHTRCPIQANEGDLAGADLIVAVKEAEHRPILAAKFPALADRVRYWHIHDVDCARPEEALPDLEQQVLALCCELSPGTR